MTTNVIYVREVIYARVQTLRTPDRVAYRHREIRGPARKSPRSGTVFL
jgi:hypothetical protein